MTRSTRRSARLQANDVEEKVEEPTSVSSSSASTKAHQPMKEQNDAVLSEDEEEAEAYEFDGKVYKTYQEMCQAKRQRNQQVLQESGLLSLSSQIHHQATTTTASAAAKKRGLTAALQKQKKKESAEPRRKSRRLNGQQAPNMYIEDERGGKFSFAGGGAEDPTSSSSSSSSPPIPSFYGDRMNDGSDMTLTEAVRAIGEKWLEDDSVQQAQRFCQKVLQPAFEDPTTFTNESAANSSQTTSPPKKKSKSTAGKKKKKQSPRSVALVEDDDDDTSFISTQLNRLTVGGVAPDDEEAAAEATIKLVPDRIYSVAAHPSTDQIIVSAGDKQGYVGFWNASTRQTDNNKDNSDEPKETKGGSKDGDIDNVTPKNPDHHLVRVHKRPVTSMEWMPDGQSLLTTSYDGTCRLWNVPNQSFVQVLGAYDDEASQYSGQPGFGLDLGGHFWFQSSTVLDQNSFLLSTSVGTVLHMDLRQKQIAWNAILSERKINTVSVHPNGYSMISSGLDTCVSLWDLRKFEQGEHTKAMNPLAMYQGGKSVNSAYFSPVTGQHIVATTMNNRLDILEDFHLQGSTGKKTKIVAVSNSMRHDNMTGRWLSTFMAQWHPSVDDLFCVGSMEKPRNVHVYDTKQQRAAVGGLSAVVSRVCFHPSPHELILAGGNSSGRVTVVREYRGDEKE